MKNAGGLAWGMAEVKTLDSAVTTLDRDQFQKIQPAGSEGGHEVKQGMICPFAQPDWPGKKISQERFKRPLLCH